MCTRIVFKIGEMACAVLKKNREKPPRRRRKRRYYRVCLRCHQGYPITIGNVACRLHTRGERVKQRRRAERWKTGSVCIPVRALVVTKGILIPCKSLPGCKTLAGIGAEKGYEVYVLPCSPWLSLNMSYRRGYVACRLHGPGRWRWRWR